LAETEATSEQPYRSLLILNRHLAAMNLSVGLTTSASVNKIRWVAERADNLGFYGSWVGEDIGRPQEIFTAVSLLLLKTKRLKVGIGVTSPLIRNITTVARAAVTLNEISPNRFRLGLGVGGIQDLARMGIRIEKPVELMRRTVELLRSVWRGQDVPLSDEEYGLRDYRAKFANAEEIPIFMGVRGPKLLALAADISDGLILSGPKRYIEESIKLVLSRRAALGLDRSRFCFCLWNPTILLHDRSNLEIVKKTVAVVAADTPDSVLEMGGIADNEVNTVRAEMKRSGIEGAAKNVSDRLVDQFCISGDAESICDSFLDYSKLGVDEVVFGPPYGRDRRHAIEEVAEVWKKSA
jgi:5,10-methylenetetrahydromethanopterin reductase